MITVSDSFKNAVKSQNRKIHGYVDIMYENKDFQTSVDKIPTKSDIVSDNGIISGKKVMNKYATLEDNYTLLDGSYVVWNENVVSQNGYISENTFENINDNEIIIENSSTTLSTKGISIYFTENLPFNFTVTFTKSDNGTIIDNVTNNTSYVYHYVFDKEQYISSISISISSIEYPKNRIRIACIDFNLGDLYEGNELVRFEVNEELDLIGETLPINTCIINLNNYPDSDGGNKFDVINPKGIVKYLNDNVEIKPYIGLLTEENGIEYVPMGTFYLSDWSSDPNGNVTLNGKSILSKLQGLSIKPASSYFFTGSLNSENLSNTILNTANVNTDFINYSNTWNNSFLQNSNIFDYIKALSPILLYYDNFTVPYSQYRKLYVDRYNTIKLDVLEQNSIDNISRNQLVEDVDYDNKNRIKEINITQNAYGVYSNYRSSTIIPSFTYTLNSNEDYLWFVSQNQLVSETLSISYTVVSGNATATLVGYNSNMICIKVTGTIDSILSISCSGSICDVQKTTKTETYYNENVENGDKININLENNIYVTPKYIAKLLFGMDKIYQVKAKTLGDPSLEIGDSISIQTRYTDTNNGYKDIIITKQRFTFDGGLRCELEGVGD